MCTAAAYRKNGFYFGRNLDYEMSYGEEIVITPRNFRFDFTAYGANAAHYAMIGTAHMAGGYPLYYDAANEKGLCIAGLNFVNSASYSEKTDGCTAPFELIPLVLAKCADIGEARVLLSEITLGNIPFSEQLPAAKLHWILADKNETIVEFRCKKPQIEWFVQKDPITYYNDQFIGNEKMRNWYEKEFKWLLDFVNSLDPNSVTLKVQFSQSKKNKEEYTYYNTFLEYQNASGEAIATPFVTATEEAVSICDLYNDVRIIPNLKRFEELIKQRTK